MSLAAACGWTLLRSLLIAVLAIPICIKFQQAIDTLNGWPRKIAWALAASLFLAPELIVAYGYSNYQLSLIRYPSLNETLYAVLVTLKVIPVGIVITHFTPAAPMSAEAMHCLKLSTTHSTLQHKLRYWKTSLSHGPRRVCLSISALSFLLAFQEFEMASFFSVASWTVWLFDQQVGGLVLSESLKFTVLPVLVESVILVPIALIVTRGNALESSFDRQCTPVSRKSLAMLWFYLILGAIGSIAIPFSIVGQGFFDGIAVLLRDKLLRDGFIKSLFTAAGFGFPVAILCYYFAGLITDSGRGNRWAILVVCLPGLFGALTIGLITLAVFQTDILYPIYDTFLPLSLGMMLYWLPRAVLLRLLLRSMHSPESQYSAWLLTGSTDPMQRRSGRQLLWRERYSGHFWMLTVLCFWAYMELTLPSLLAPVGLVTAPSRLYEKMHFGRNAVLSAMTVATVVTPVIALVIINRLSAFVYFRMK